MFVGDHLVDGTDRHAALVGTGVLGGDDQVDAVWFAADLVFDPLQINLQLTR